MRRSVVVPRARAALPSIGLLVLAAVAAAPAGRAAPAPDDEGTARVRFVQAIPEASRLDVYVDGELEVEGLGYATATDVVELPAGERTVAVTSAGDGPDGAVAEAEVALEAGATYAVAVAGLLADAELRSYPIDLVAPGPGESRLRVLHLSPDTPAIDVAVAAGDVLVAGATFDRSPGAVDVGAGTYDMVVRPAGSAEVLQAIPGVGIAAGRSYTIAAVGLLRDDGAVDIVAFFAPLAAERLPSVGTGAGRGPGCPPLALGAAAVACAGVAARGRARTAEAGRDGGAAGPAA